MAFHNHHRYIAMVDPTEAHQLAEEHEKRVIRRYNWAYPEKGWASLEDVDQSVAMLWLMQQCDSLLGSHYDIVRRGHCMSVSWINQLGESQIMGGVFRDTNNGLYIAFCFIG